MRPETANLLNRLDATDWFSSVGQPTPESLRGSVIQVSSWREAIDCASSTEWENFTIEQRNRLTMHLHRHARERYQDWNDLTDSIKQVLEPQSRIERGEHNGTVSPGVKMGRGS
jgi:hypothetical protein